MLCTNLNQNHVPDDLKKKFYEGILPKNPTLGLHWVYPIRCSFLFTKIDYDI
jgi:hypothetical protein